MVPTDTVHPICYVAVDSEKYFSLYLFYHQKQFVFTWKCHQFIISVLLITSTLNFSVLISLWFIFHSKEYYSLWHNLGPERKLGGQWQKAKLRKLARARQFSFLYIKDFKDVKDFCLQVKNNGKSLNFFKTGGIGKDGNIFENCYHLNNIKKLILSKKNNMRIAF